jgi:hypothetical protein
VIVMVVVMNMDMIILLFFDCRPNNLVGICIAYGIFHSVIRSAQKYAQSPAMVLQTYFAQSAQIPLTINSRSTAR